MERKHSTNPSDLGMCDRHIPRSDGFVGVTNMRAMFEDAAKFNQDIGAWNTSAVKDLSYMSFGAISFNKPIGHWNVPAVLPALVVTQVWHVSMVDALQ